MDRQRRRGRKGRALLNGNQLNQSPNVAHQLQLAQKRCFFHSLTSFLILTSLIGIVYLMLDYHCYNCSTKSNLNNVTRNIEEISHNLSLMNNHYYDLEMQISQFSEEFPKVEKQIKLLDELASSVEHREFGWDPKSHGPLPNVDVFLKKPH